MSGAHRACEGIRWPFAHADYIEPGRNGGKAGACVMADLRRTGGDAMPPCVYTDDPAYDEPDGACSRRGSCAYALMGVIERAGSAPSWGRVEIRDYPAVRGGYFAVYPVRRGSVTVEALTEDRLSCDTGLGLSLDESEFYDLLFKGFVEDLYDPDLPENQAWLAMMRKMGRELAESVFEWNLEENFYSVSVFGDALDRARCAAEALRDGRLDDPCIPPCAVSVSLGRGFHTAGQLADFYERFATKARGMAALDPDEYVISFFGP